MKINNFFIRFNMRTLLLASIFIMCSNLNAQITFEKTYKIGNGSYGREVKQTSDSGYIITGYTTKWNVFLLKTNSKGDSLWAKIYKADKTDKGLKVLISNDGGYIVLGTTNSFSSDSSEQIYLIKTDDNGDTLWTKKYNGYGHTIKQTYDNGYIIAGAIDSSIYLIKTDSAGIIMWTKKYAENSNFNYNHPSYVFHEPDTSYFVWTIIDDYLNAIRINSQGDTLWTKIYSNQYLNGYLFEVEKTKDDEYLIADDWGFFKVVDGDTWYYLGTLIDGNPEYPYPAFIKKDIKNNRYVTLEHAYRLRDKYFTIFLTAYDSTGDNEMFWRSYDSPYGTFNGTHFIIYNLQNTYDNGYVLTGTVNDTCGYNPQLVYLLKTDEDLIRWYPSEIITNDKNNLLFTIYPNPTKNKITIKHNFNVRDFKYRLLNMNGVVEIEGFITKSVTSIDLTSLSEGIYIIELFDNNHMITHKIIKH